MDIIEQKYIVLSDCKSKDIIDRGDIKFLQRASLVRRLMQCWGLYGGELPRVNVDSSKTHLVIGRDLVPQEVRSEDEDSSIFIFIFEISGANIEDIALQESNIFVNMLDYYYKNSINGVSVSKDTVTSMLANSIDNHYVLFMSLSTCKKCVSANADFYGDNFSDDRIVIGRSEVMRSSRIDFSTKIYIAPEIKDGDIYGFSNPISVMLERQRVRHLDSRYFEEIGIGLLNGGDNNIIKYEIDI